MRTLLSLGLLALLSACAARPEPRHEAPPPDEPAPVYQPGSPDEPEPRYEPEPHHEPEPRYEPEPRHHHGDPLGWPLEARIVDVNGRILVETSRPAYVAVFEIVPGRGVGLLYPGYVGENNYVPGGVSPLWITRTRSYYGYFQAVGPAYPRDTPRYLYLVASEIPLRTGELIRHPGMLRSALGIQHYAAWSPHSVLHELDALVVRDLGSHGWTSDLYAVWPERRYRDRVATLDWVRVRCTDGRIIEGPAYYVRGACDEAAAPVPPLRQGPETPPGTAEDSVRVPTRTRPEPEGEGASREGDGEPRIAPPARRPEPPEPEVERLLPGPGRRGEPGERGRVEPREVPRVAPPTTERPEPQARPGSGPESRRQPETRERVEPRETPRAQPREQPPATPRVAPRPEPREEPRAAPRVEPRSEPRPAPRVEPRPEPRPEPVQQPRFESPPPRAEPPPRVEVPRSEPAPAVRPDPDPR